MNLIIYKENREQYHSEISEPWNTLYNQCYKEANALIPTNLETRFLSTRFAFVFHFVTSSFIFALSQPNQRTLQTVLKMKCDLISVFGHISNQRKWLQLTNNATLWMKQFDTQRVILQPFWSSPFFCSLVENLGSDNSQKGKLGSDNSLNSLEISRGGAQTTSNALLNLRKVFLLLAFWYFYHRYPICK